MTKDIDVDDAKIIELDADQVVEETALPKDSDAPKAVTPRKSRSRLVVGAAALLAAAVGGGWFYKDVLSSYFPSDQVLVLQERIDGLEKGNADLLARITQAEGVSKAIADGLNELENKHTTLAQTSADVAAAQSTAGDKLIALEKQIADAQKSVKDLASRPVVTADGSASVDGAALVALQSRIEALDKDMAALKVAPSDAGDNKALLSQSLGDLKARVAAGAGFSAELSRLQQMVPAAQGLDVLQRFADKGSPDAKGLAAALTALAPELPVPTPAKPDAEKGWLEAAADSLAGIITIRSEDDIDWRAKAVEVAALAEGGDIAKAIEALNTVPGDKPVGVAQWIEKAQGRMAVEAALQSVEEAVLRVIAAKG
jgi:hypothetical protein